MKKQLAIFIGKLITLASRLFKMGGGSSLPGLIALRIEPRILSRLLENTHLNSVIVTGSNGKTTTCRMIAEVMKEEGLQVVWNRSGANLVSGIVSVLIEKADWLGRIQADAAVFEVDEATLRHVISAIKPNHVVVTNFFRDQLDRYGEVDTTRDLIRTALKDIPADSMLLLNVDDPLVASLAEGALCPVKTFGVKGFQAQESANAPATYQSKDARNCEHCGTAFEYEQVSYGHLGKYRCPHCGYARPSLQFAADDILLQGTHGSVFTVVSITESEPEQTGMNISLSLPGLYNVYNGLTAAACCLSMGFNPTLIQKTVSNISSAFGRMETIRVGDKEILLALVKNPVGFSEVARTLALEGSHKTLLLCLNDQYADGRDISWIWDADVELLAEKADTFDTVVASGIRAWDMALRLKYAGIPEEKITVEPSLDKALKLGLSRVKPDETLYILPTYTAMLQIREHVRHLGKAREFWQG